MNENEPQGVGPDDPHGPGSEPRQAPRAKHGYRNEVSWDNGKGAQPYANQDAALGPSAAHESEAGNRGAASGRNLEQLEQLKQKPDRPVGEAPREDVSGEGGVS